MNYVVLMETIVKIIAIICGIGLPILIVWLDNRKKINETNQRTQIVMSALEKNPNLDVEELVKKMAPMQKKTLLKEVSNVSGELPVRRSDCSQPV